VFSHEKKSPAIGGAFFCPAIACIGTSTACSALQLIGIAAALFVDAIALRASSGFFNN
jgi:hypothetical protein